MKKVYIVTTERLSYPSTYDSRVTSDVHKAVREALASVDRQLTVIEKQQFITLVEGNPDPGFVVFLPVSSTIKDGMKLPTPAVSIRIARSID